MGEGSSQVDPHVVERVFDDLRSGRDEVAAPGYVAVGCQLAERLAEPSPHAVADDGRPDLAGDGERQAGRRFARQERDHHRATSTSATLPLQPLQRGSIADTPDQADRRWRPLALRLRITARPALVAIR